MASNIAGATEAAQVQEDQTDSESSSLTDSSEGESDSGSDYGVSDPEQQGASASGRTVKKEACKYYNLGHCNSGKKCQYLHVCKYSLKGNCKKGKRCHLQHIYSHGSPSSSDEDERGRRRRSSSTDQDSPDGKPYRWQINAGDGWMDIDNDFIIEAQYSQPAAKGIKLYNTIYGAISIDFNQMKVLKKRIRVRRKSSDTADQENEWLWYYCGKHRWTLFGEKDAKGKMASVKSSRIEKEFQKKPKHSYAFTCGQTKYEIHFKEMKQVNLTTGRKRRVARRPRFSMPEETAKKKSVEASFQQLQVSSGGTTPVWQFKGKSGKWYNFKHRSGTDTECSISSRDIEDQYQHNPAGSMTFTAGIYQYSLDFLGMTQTNLASNKTRQIQRITI
ncbi:PAR12 polymerase, partial [Amia calva]|nr:PAR12 polymerase [Amia calva]